MRDLQAFWGDINIPFAPISDFKRGVESDIVMVATIAWSPDLDTCHTSKLASFSARLCCLENFHQFLGNIRKIRIF
jgi:hypothetical protein